LFKFLQASPHKIEIHTHPKKGDGGRDIIGKYRNFNFVIQAKYHYMNKKTQKRNKISPSVIRDFLGTLTKYHNDKEYSYGIIVTNSEFTEIAENEAKNLEDVNRLFLCHYKDLDIILEKIYNIRKKVINNYQNTMITSTSENVTNLQFNFNNLNIYYEKVEKHVMTLKGKNFK
jgi:type IV secretory pathway TraG/TraD family ATPase VirD4